MDAVRAPTRGQSPLLPDVRASAHEEEPEAETGGDGGEQHGAGHPPGPVAVLAGDEGDGGQRQGDAGERPARWPFAEGQPDGDGHDRRDDRRQRGHDAHRAGRQRPVEAHEGDGPAEAAGRPPGHIGAVEAVTSGQGQDDEQRSEAGALGDERHDEGWCTAAGQATEEVAGPVDERRDQRECDRHLSSVRKSRNVTETTPGVCSPSRSALLWGAVHRVGLSARYQLEGRHPGSFSPWVLGIDLAAAFEGPAQRELVGVLEVTADGQPAGDAGHLQRRGAGAGGPGTWRWPRPRCWGSCTG